MLLTSFFVTRCTTLSNPFFTSSAPSFTSTASFREMSPNLYPCRSVTVSPSSAGTVSAHEHLVARHGAACLFKELLHVKQQQDAAVVNIRSCFN
jgi:hypothetical protein